MPVWEISAPDGSTYEIEGDSEPTQDELDRMFPAPPITQIADFPVRAPGITLGEDLRLPTPVTPGQTGLVPSIFPQDIQPQQFAPKALGSTAIPVEPPQPSSFDLSGFGTPEPTVAEQVFGPRPPRPYSSLTPKTESGVDLGGIETLVPEAEPAYTVSPPEGGKTPIDRYTSRISQEFSQNPLDVDYSVNEREANAISQQLRQESAEGWDALREFWYGTPLSAIGFTPENIPSGKEIEEQLGIPSAIAAPFSALDKAMAGFLGFLTSPNGITQVTAAGVPVLKPIMMAKWIGDMISAGGESASRFGQALGNGDYQGAWDALVEYGSTAGLLAGIPGVRVKGKRVKGLVEHGVESVRDLGQVARIRPPWEPGSNVGLQTGASLRPPAEREVPISTGVPEVTAPEGVELPPPRPESARPAPEPVAPRPQEAIASELGGIHRATVRNVDIYEFPPAREGASRDVVRVPAGSPIEVVRDKLQTARARWEPEAPAKPEAPTVTETTAPVPPEEMPTTPTVTGVRPAIRLVGGKVIAGDAGMTHPEIIKANDLKTTDIDQRGFVNERGEFMDREQTAVQTGVTTEKEPARQHSTDLPEAKPEEAATTEYIKNLPNQPFPERTEAQKSKDDAAYRRLIEEKYRFASPEVQREHGIDPKTGLIPVEAKPSAAPAEAAKPAVAKMGTDDSIKNLFGDPHDTRYHATAEDWAEWQRLTNEFDAAIKKRDRKAAEAARAAKDTMKRRYGGMPLEAPKPAAKKPWQMTKAEWIEYTRATLEPTNAELRKQGFQGAVPNENAHYNQVKHAIERGDSVPPEVLADYPDLKPAETAPALSVTKAEEKAGAHEIDFESASGDRVKVRVYPERYSNLSDDAKSQVDNAFRITLELNEPDFPKWEKIKQGKSPVTVIERFERGESRRSISLDSPDVEFGRLATRDDLYDAKLNKSGKDLRDRLISEKELAEKAKADKEASEQAEYDRRTREFQDYRSVIEKQPLPTGKKYTLEVTNVKGEKSQIQGTRYGDWFIHKVAGGGRRYSEPTVYKVSHVGSALGVSDKGLPTLQQAKNYIRALIHAKVRGDWNKASDLSKSEHDAIVEVGKAWVSGGNVPSYFKAESAKTGLAKNIRERLKAGEAPGAEAGGGVPIGDLIHEYGLKLYETVKDKAQWTARMIKELGENVRIWLNDVWLNIIHGPPADPFEVAKEIGYEHNPTEQIGSMSTKGLTKDQIRQLRLAGNPISWEFTARKVGPQVPPDMVGHTFYVRKGASRSEILKRANQVRQDHGLKPLGTATPLTLEVEAGAGINIPLPSLGSVLDTVRDLPEKTRTLWRAFSMQSLPRITRASRETGEAGVRYASSPSVARAKGLMFAERVTEGIRDRDFNQKFGVGLTEDNLRGIKQSFNEQAAAAATPEEAQALRDKANSVVSMIGAENSPFQTEAQYQAFMRSADAQRAIRRHIRLWENEKDPIYRQARDLDPDVELETRGAQFGARINLKAVRPGEPVRTAVGPSTRSPLIRATATIRRTDPFGRAAKGTGTYDGSYSEIMANGFGREYPVAKQHDFIKKLIDSGQATVSNREFEPDLTIGGEATKGYPLRLNPWGGKFLQIRRSLAPEYEDVTGLHPAAELGLYTKAANVATRLSVTGLAEGSTHVSNLLTQAFTGMGPTANPFLNALVKSLGRADVLYSVPRILIKSFGDRRADMLKLAEIGAAKDPYRGTVGWFITKIDQGTRLYAAEVYKRMAAKGWVPDTETGLREYVNQVGQYNKRLQPRSIQLLRTTGIQPFATAMQTFNVQGLRTLAAAPGIKGSTKLAAVGLRAEKAANILGFLGVVTALNMLVSGTPAGPKGTRIGAVGWIDDKKKLRQFDLGTLTGITRGARITGLQPAIEARRLGLSKGASLMAGFRGAATTGLSAATGPLNRAAFMTVTGKRVGVPPTQEAKVMPPQREQDFTPLKTQLASNIAQAAQEASPLVDFAVRMKQGKGEEAVTRQFTRYTPKTGMAAETIEKLPKIVEKGQLNDYLDSVAKEAFKLSPGQREAYVRKRFREDELPASMRTEAQTKLRRRGLFPKKI